ncbi:MAG: phosphoglycolate phosphatase [Burkholderiaceae bacterium]
MTAVALVLFDLDGTLADTAPDLAGAVNRMLMARGRTPLPLKDLRPVASHGARGLLGRAFGVVPTDPDFEALRQEFFREYERALCVESSLFPAMDTALTELESRGVLWGIVTNKVARFTEPLVRALGLHERAACVVSGDTAVRPKPDPAPLLHALAATSTEPGAALYVGDDLRDIQAGRAAGLRTVAVSYGYLGDGPHYAEWGADHIIHSPSELLALVRT